MTLIPLINIDTRNYTEGSIHPLSRSGGPLRGTFLLGRSWTRGAPFSQEQNYDPGVVRDQSYETDNGQFRLGEPSIV